MKIVDQIEQSIFREYDLRGIVPKDINEDVSYTIGKSFGTYIKNLGEVETIIGHDNRESGIKITKSLIKGILDTGINVINIGLVTTPMYYFAKIYYDLNTGIMVTASHNPKEYNGFKIAFDKVSNAYGKKIYDFRDFTNKKEFSNGNGKEKIIDIKAKYIDNIVNSIDLGPKKVKAVFDCGNGTTSEIIKEVLDKFNIEYSLLYATSDSNFPNHVPDPCVHANMKDLQKKVKELNYDVGIALDGDGDRVGIVDEKGNIISADLYMAIIYRSINSKMKKRKALFDVKCSKSLTDELDKLGIEKSLNRTGNSYAKMEMERQDLDFGGEYSGHVFFRDRYLGIDDGIYAGLRMIELLSKTDKPTSSFLEGINKYYSTEELKFSVEETNKFNIVDQIKAYAKAKNYDLVTIDGVRVNFDDGWALVRASNTGPNITARFEANTKSRLEEIQREFVNKLEEIIKSDKF